MFATLAGGYPRTPLSGVRLPVRGEAREEALRAAEDELVREIIAEQEEAGLEPLTDGHVRWEDEISGIARGLDGLVLAGDMPYFDTGSSFRQPQAVAEPRWRGPITVEDWRFAASCTHRAVKQTLTGPYTLGRLSDPGDVGRERLTAALAEALNQELRALAAAGCPLVQVDENAATMIGDDPAEQRLFRDAQRRLLDGVEGTHRSLAITMGNADHAGTDTIFGAPYHSYLFDLIGGPDNWRLIAQAPGERGIICGALDARNPALDSTEVLIWAAHYAASTRGRGLARVGLSPSASLASLPRDRAREKVVLLGETVRLASAGTAEEVAAALDPRAIDIRSAALGRYAPRRPAAAARPDPGAGRKNE